MKIDIPSCLAIHANARIEFEARKSETEDGPAPLPAIEMVAYTGAAMRLSGWGHPVLLDMDGLEIASQNRPIRFNHEASAGVGHTDRIAIKDGRLVASGVISRDTPEAREVVAAAANGFPWQASLGAGVEKYDFIRQGDTVSVNGREWKGPLIVVRRATLGEISLVDAGADGGTVARIAARADEGAPPAEGDEPELAGALTRESVLFRHRVETERRQTIAALMQESLDQPGIDTTAVEELAAKAETERWPVLMFENQLLKLSRPAPLPRRSSGLASGRVIEAAVCTAGGLHDLEGAFDAGTLEAAHQSFPHGLGLVDLFMLAARQNGYTGHSSKDVRGMLQAAFRADVRATGGGGFSTLSLPGIMTNVANKFLAAGFAAIESTWRAIAVIGSARDFKTITSYSLTGGLVYEKVGPGGEIKHGDLSELAYTNQIATYARMFAVTRTDIINDDLGALSQIPSRLGRGAALKLNDVFWAAFMDNATFFTTLRGNYFDGAESALSIDSLTTAEAMFMNQTDPDGQPVGVMPSILLVPNALFTTANNLMNSTQIVGGTTAQLANNPHAGKYQVVRSSYLSNASYTGNSTTAWYLLADPAALGVIEVRFLNGRETPIVESADADFNTLGVQMRGYHDFGVAKQEYRAGVKSKGVV